MRFDIIIIGGGILGYSAALQLKQKCPDLKICVLEKESHLCVHQTGHNSGVIHAGVYYPPGSLKAKFCLEGNRATIEFCRQYEIPFKQPGKLIVATNEIELSRMQNLAARCLQNNLNYTVLNEQETKQKQPGINAVGSIFVADTGIVNWQQVTQKYAEHFSALGGKSFFNSQVLEISETASSITVRTTNGSYESGYVISCAGLYADRVVAMAKIKPKFKIIPFRGEYYRLADKYSQLFQHLIYPVPDPNLPFLGVHFTPQIAGYTTVGPNAVLALAREGYSWRKWNWRDACEILTFKATWQSILHNFSATINELKSSMSKAFYLKRLQKYYPTIKADELVVYPAGVRAQAIDSKGQLVDDFMFAETTRMLHTCNAPSPAATSSLPIGNYIAVKMIRKMNVI